MRRMPELRIHVLSGGSFMRLGRGSGLRCGLHVGRRSLQQRVDVAGVVLLLEAPETIRRSSGAKASEKLGPVGQGHVKPPLAPSVTAKATPPTVTDPFANSLKPAAEPRV